MSFWTYIHGSILVDVPGRSQPEIQYIISSILEHLPRVTGSEGDMEVYLQRRDGHNCSSSCDEYGNRTNNLKDWYGYKSRDGVLSTQSEYIITVRAGLRDRVFKQTRTEFMKWLTRLAKRVWVQDVLVRIESDLGESITLNLPDGMYEVFESPSWGRKKFSFDEKEFWWCEHLMWEPAPDSDEPFTHALKYNHDERVKEEFERRQKWEVDIERGNGS